MWLPEPQKTCLLRVSSVGDLHTSHSLLGSPQQPCVKPHPFCLGGVAPGLSQPAPGPCKGLLTPEFLAPNTVPGTINSRGRNEYLYHIVTAVATISLSLGQQDRAMFRDSLTLYLSPALQETSIPSSEVRVACRYRWSGHLSQMSRCHTSNCLSPAHTPLGPREVALPSWPNPHQPQGQTLPICQGTRALKGFHRLPVKARKIVVP